VLAEGVEFDFAWVGVIGSSVVYSACSSARLVSLVSATPLASSAVKVSAMASSDSRCSGDMRE